MAREFLARYLNDHLAGAQAALEIVSLLRRPDDSDVWRRIDADIIEDRRELETLMQNSGVAPGTVRRAVAWAGEKLAELKMRVDDPSDGALRRLELIEALALGIDGKRALWTALQRSSGGVVDLDLDYTRLIARAEQQRRVVEEQRLEAAASALIS